METLELQNREPLPFFFRGNSLSQFCSNRSHRPKLFDGPFLCSLNGIWWKQRVGHHRPLEQNFGNWFPSLLSAPPPPLQPTTWICAIPPQLLNMPCDPCQMQLLYRAFHLPSNYKEWVVLYSGKGPAEESYQALPPRRKTTPPAVQLFHVTGYHKGVSHLLKHGKYPHSLIHSYPLFAEAVGMQKHGSIFHPST